MYVCVGLTTLKNKYKNYGLRQTPQGFADVLLEVLEEEAVPELSDVSASSASSALVAAEPAGKQVLQRACTLGGTTWPPHSYSW